MYIIIRLKIIEIQKVNWEWFINIFYQDIINDFAYFMSQINLKTFEEGIRLLSLIFLKPK